MISDELILTGLITNSTIRAAANSLEVSEKTIYERLRDSDFSQRYSELKLQALQDSVDALQKHIFTAVDTLAEVAADTTAREAARVAAAKGIIENYVRLDEYVNLVNRVSNLEKAIKENEHDN